MRTIEQDRAKAAWDAVRGVGSNQAQYLSLARSAPADIHNHGLAQTLAFWQAKRQPHHLALCGHVSAWTMGQLDLTHDRLLEWITHRETTSDQYRRAITEALAYLVWIKRFAEAEFSGAEFAEAEGQ